MASRKREIGPVGTASRVLVGLTLLYLALIDGPPFQGQFEWDLRPSDAALGLAVLPGIAIVFGLAARRYASGDVHFNGVLGITLNCAVIVVLVTNPYTAPGALIFYGATLLVAAVRGQAGCEATAVSNWVLGRNDQIGCPTFTPIDELEAHRRHREAAATG
jgi:hypothetical protein